jgi:hypothetical protein
MILRLDRAGSLPDALHALFAEESLGDIFRSAIAATITPSIHSREWSCLRRSVPRQSSDASSRKRDTALTQPAATMWRGRWDQRRAEGADDPDPIVVDDEHGCPRRGPSLLVPTARLSVAHDSGLELLVVDPVADRRLGQRLGPVRSGCAGGLSAKVGSGLASVRRESHPTRTLSPVASGVCRKRTPGTLAGPQGAVVAHIGRFAACGPRVGGAKVSESL